MNSKQLRRWASVLCVCLLWVSPVHSTPEQEQAARTLFQRARKLMAQSKFHEACPMLAESLRLHSGLGTQFNLAHCYQQLGKKASAHALFLQVADAAHEAERAETALERARELEPELNYILIEMKERVPDVTVHLDGAPPSGTWEMPLPVDPGEHVLSVEAKGYVTFESALFVPETDTVTSIVVPPLKPLYPSDEDAVPPKPKGEEQTAPAPERFGGAWGLRQWALVGSGTLVLSGAALGIATSVRANDERVAASRLCPEPSRGCEAWEVRTFERREQEFESYRTWAIVGFGVAAISTVTFTTLFFTGDSDSSDSPRERVSLSVAPDAVEANLRLDF